MALLGARGRASYRAAYLRLIEGVGSSEARSIGKNGDLILGDLVYALRPDDELRLGVHLYYLTVGKRLPLGDTEEWWIGATMAGRQAEIDWDAFAILNTGRLGIGVLDDAGRVVSGFDRSDAHRGYAFKAEAARTIGPVRASVQLLYSSGDRDEATIEDRFVSPEGLFGTEGYWAYTHIFTANGPSDVNDLAVELGNAGAGILTLQGRLTTLLHPRLRGELFGGWFRATHSRNSSRDMGSEIGAMGTFSIAEALSLDVGAAGAFLGEFFGSNPDRLYEVFTRFQFQY